MDGETMPRGDKTIVDIASLDAFRATLAARLSEAQSILDDLVGDLGTPPALGALPDASYVGGRYSSLYAEHVDRASRLVQAITAADAAIAAMRDNYLTIEERVTANATEIGNLLGGVSGALIGDRANAR